MGVVEVKEKLLSVSIHTIQIEGSADRDDAKGFIFIGSLDEYVTALRTLGVSFVFLASELLEEDDFVYVPDISGTDEENEDSIVDLVAIQPALGKYKKHIGQQCRYKLSAPMSNSTLDYLEQEVWWKEFEDLWNEAVESVDAEKEEEESRIQIVQNERDQKLIQDIQTLINDKVFICLPTQRAMLEYVRENVPGVNKLDPYLLKEEIRTLDAKIKARRLQKNSINQGIRQFDEKTKK